MTVKQLALDTLRGKNASRVPVALMAGGVWSATHLSSSLKEMSASPETMAGMLINAADIIDSDIVYAGSGYTNIHAASVGGKEPVWRENGALDLNTAMVESEDEFDSLNPANVDRYGLVETVKEAYKLARREIGEERLVTITAWGPFTNAARIAGEETFVKGIYKNPAYIERILNFVTDMLIHLFTPLADDGELDVILLGDPTASGDLISRKQFERFAVPYLKRFTDWARSRNIMTMVHICGDTNDRLDLFPRTGAECITLDSKVDMAKAKQALHGAMCFAGNVDPVGTMMSGSAQQVEDECKRLLEIAGSDGGFILMPGCDIPPTVPLENIQALMKTGREWRF